MFKIKDLIVERQKYELGGRTNHRTDPWRDELLSHVITNATEDEIALITLASRFDSFRSKQAILEKYHFAGVYMLGRIFPNIGLTFYVIHLSKKAMSGLKVALYRGKCHNFPTRGQNKDIWALPESFTEEWEKYVSLLEQWMNGSEIPKSEGEYEFNYVPRAQLYKGSLSPETYSKENIELRKRVAERETKPLSFFAEVLTPYQRSRDVNKVKVIKLRDLEYPLDIDKIGLDTPTSIVLQKGDIVIPRFANGNKRKAFLFNYEGEEIIYAAQTLFVIKCKKILPEYLYLYLTSDIAAKLLTSTYIDSFSLHRMSKDELVDFPVAPLKGDEQKYISDFNTLTSVGIRDYDHLRQFNADYERMTQIRTIVRKPEDVGDIFNLQLANRIKACHEEQLRSFLTDDLKELNACFKAKAYKATLILAGSILEAVLIDWVSEIHGKNYFQEEYEVTDKWSGRKKRADLIDFIDAIKEIKYPSWFEEARKAHIIRKKRNLVHAKLCMNTDEISERVCREVISYLIDVLKTREVISNP